MTTPLPDTFRRADESDDALFYAQPRFVTHIDDGAIAAVTRLYRERLPGGGAVLDLMSSWISHLPDDVRYRAVTGLGMNASELAANRRLDRRIVQDLNKSHRLPFVDGEFDAVTICVSVDYLVRPVAVLRELARATRAGGVLVITFSNRCFPTKVIEPWLMLGDHDRVGLVAEMVRQAGGWGAIEMLECIPPGGPGDPLFAVVARRGE